MLRDFVGHSRILGGLARYGPPLGWLVRRGFAGRWKYLLGIVGANVVGVTTGASAFGLILVYVRAQASGPEDRMSGIAAFIASHWGTGVGVYAAAALVLGAVSAGCTYFAARGALHIARDFHAATVREAVLNAGRGDCETDDIAMLAPSHGARHIPGLYARHAATVLRLLLEAVLPLVTSVVAVGALVYIDPLITLSLLPPAIVGILVLGRLSRRGARLLRRYQEKASEIAPLVSETFGAGGGGDAESDALSSSEVLRDTLESLYDQTLLSRQVQLTNRVLQVVSVAWLVFLFGRHLERGTAGWSSILVYLIALRYAWQCVGRLAVLVVEIARFMPSVEVCARFVTRPPSVRAER